MSAVDAAEGRLANDMRTSETGGTRVSPSSMDGADARASEHDDCSLCDDGHETCRNIGTSAFSFSYRPTPRRSIYKAYLRYVQIP